MLLDVLMYLYIGSQDINEPSVQLKLKVKNTDTGVVEPVSFNIASDKFRVLLNGRLIYLPTIEEGCGGSVVVC